MLTPPKPEPSAEDLADARDLPRAVLDRAIARYEEATAIAERAGALAGLNSRVDRFAELAVDQAVDAESELIRAILATDPGLEHPVMRKLEKGRHRARGVRSGGRTYLAVPDPGHEGDAKSTSGPDRMHLRVVESDAVLDVDGLGSWMFPMPPRRAQSAEPARAEPSAPRPAGGDDLWPEILRETIRIFGPEEVWRRVAGLPPKWDG